MSKIHVLMDLAGSEGSYHCDICEKGNHRYVVKLSHSLQICHKCLIYLQKRIEAEAFRAEDSDDSRCGGCDNEGLDCDECPLKEG